MKLEKKIPEKKIKLIKDLEEYINTKKTILVASIKNIPNSQFQEISKKMRGKAIVKVPKKRLIFMALDKSSNKEISKLKEKIKEGFAILFSDLDSFELSGELMNNQSPAKAKAGQESPINIEIPEGPTDLVPGPAISELGALGIKIKIDKGKINIIESKIIAKAGEKISSGASDLMSKLSIKPFKVGFVPLCAFDNVNKKFYSEIKIDRKGTLEQLKNSYSKALAFSVEISYSSPETIKFLISKAGGHERVIEKLSLSKAQNQEQKSPEENKFKGGN